MTAKYEKEKNQILQVRNLKAQLDDLKGQVEKYERENDFNKVAEIKYGEIPKLEAQIKQYEEKIQEVSLKWVNGREVFTSRFCRWEKTEKG